MIDPAKMDAVDQKVLGDIAKYGWSDIAVFPTKDDPGVPFNYTVGLVEYSHPDLLVMGMEHQQAHGVLTSAVRQVENGRMFFADSYFDRVIENFDVALVEITDVHHPDFSLGMATHLFGEVRGLQIVWPDTNGRFPWHDDFDEKYKDRQVLLGPWRGSV